MCIAAPVWFFGGACVVSWLNYKSDSWFGNYWALSEWWAMPVILFCVAIWIAPSIALGACGATNLEFGPLRRRSQSDRGAK
jgi:hypothetical protein